MSNTRRDAGEARQRARHPEQPQAGATGPTVTARSAGIAPAFDAAAGQPAARTDAPRGMISNPWVKQWTAGTPDRSPAPEQGPNTTQGPETGSRPASSDAGAAPNPTRPIKEP